MNDEIMLLRVRDRGQLTLPTAIRKAARLAHGGYVAAEVQEDGTIILRPKMVIDAAHAWYFTPEWQEIQLRAQREAAAGEVQTHETWEEFEAELRESAGFSAGNPVTEPVAVDVARDTGAQTIADTAVDTTSQSARRRSRSSTSPR